MTSRVQLASAVFLVALLPHPQNVKKLHKEEDKFEKQKDAVHKAKALAKLITKEIDMAATEIRKGKLQKGVARLQHYARVANQVHKELVATGRNPEKKPSGFMQLQIAMRQSVRRLDDLIYLMPVGTREPVEAVREKIDKINSQLLEELFPPPPPPKPRKKKHKG